MTITTKYYEVYADHVIIVFQTINHRGHVLREDEAYTIRGDFREVLRRNREYLGVHLVNA